MGEIAAFLLVRKGGCRMQVGVGCKWV
jgi:hypothetical protein